MKTLLNPEYIAFVNSGHLATLEPTTPVPLLMSPGEELLYIENGYTEKTTSRTTGYKTNSGGLSFRVAKGVRFHLGGGNAKAKRKTETVRSNGYLFVTSKRIVWSSSNGSFEYPIQKITSIVSHGSYISVQSGSKTHNLYIPTSDLFIKVFNLLVSKLSESNSR